VGAVGDLEAMLLGKRRVLGISAGFLERLGKLLVVDIAEPLEE